MKSFSLAWIPVVLALVACAEPVRLDHLPRHPWPGEKAVLAELRQEADQVSQVSVAGRAALTRPGGERVVLDMLGVADRAGRLRLEAMNAGGTVMDLTFVEGDLWVWSVAERFDPLQFLPKGLESDVFLSIWAMLGAPVRPGQAAEVKVNGSRFQVVQPHGPEGRHHLVMERDRVTRALLSLRIDRAEGGTVFTIFYRDHRVLPDGTLWPFEIRLGGHHGGIVTFLDEVDLSPDPGPGAFQPPAGAHRLRSPLEPGP